MTPFAASALEQLSKLHPATQVVVVLVAGAFLAFLAWVLLQMGRD